MIGQYTLSKSGGSYWGSAALLTGWNPSPCLPRSGSGGCVDSSKNSSDRFTFENGQAFYMLSIQLFIYLQMLDFVTTMIGFKLGASEASPFIVNLIHATSPAVGVGLSKLVGLGIGALCVATHRSRLVTWINYWYAGLIVWNLATIFVALGPGALPHIH